jgi:hypothetical protein
MSTYCKDVSPEAEILKLLGNTPWNVVNDWQAAYRKFAILAHPDRPHGDTPPPAVPPSTAVTCANGRSFVSGDTIGFHQYPVAHLVVFPAPSSHIGNWSAAAVLSRLNALKGQAHNRKSGKRRAFLAITEQERLSGGSFTIRYIPAVGEPWTTDIVPLSPGRGIPTVVPRAQVDVHVFFNKS